MMKKIVILLTTLLVGCTPQQKEVNKDGFVVKETTLSQIEYVFDDLDQSDIECAFEVDYKNYDVKKSYVTFYQNGQAKNFLIYDENKNPNSSQKEIFVAEQYLYYGFKKIDSHTITVTDRTYGNDGLSNSQRKFTGVTSSLKEIGYDINQASVYTNKKIKSLNGNEFILAAIYFPETESSQMTVDDEKIKQMIQDGKTLITMTVTIDPIPESVKSKRECL